MSLKLILTSTICVALLALVVIPVIDTATDEPPETDDLYVFVLAGQSNAAYYNSNVTVANDNPPIKDDYAFYYGTDSAPINCGTIANMDYDTTLNSYNIHSMTDSEGIFTIGNIEAPFASKFVNDTNQKCLIINTGIGGISINSYVPGQIGFNYASDIIADALSKIPDSYNVVKTGIIWIQGESNNALAIDTYINQFKAMFNGFKSIGFEAAYISQTRAINGGNATIAQEIIANTVSGAYIASDAASDFTIDNGMMDADNLHYTQLGDNVIGNDIASFVIQKRNMPTEMNQGLESLIMIIPLIVTVAIIMLIGTAIVTRRE